MTTTHPRSSMDSPQDTVDTAEALRARAFALIAKAEAPRLPITVSPEERIWTASLAVAYATLALSAPRSMTFPVGKVTASFESASTGEPMTGTATVTDREWRFGDAVTDHPFTPNHTGVGASCSVCPARGVDHATETDGINLHPVMIEVPRTVLAGMARGLEMLADDPHHIDEDGGLWDDAVRSARDWARENL